MSDHKLYLSRKYPGGMRFLECRECPRCIAIEYVDGEIKNPMVVNEGDTTAAHSLFIVPDVIKPEIVVSVDVDENDDDGLDLEFA